MLIPNHPTLQLRNLPRSLEAKVPFKALRDLSNRLRFGPAAPKSDECIYINPANVISNYVANPKAHAPLFRRAHSGMIVGGDWDLSVRPAGTSEKFTSVYNHITKGIPWEATGRYDQMLARIARKGHADGCRTLDEIKERYKRLDQVIELTRRIGRLKARHEMPGKMFRREHGGVLVHIDRHGRPLRHGGGAHRFAIARALGLPEMPVQLGVIHKDAFDAGVLDTLRRSIHDGRRIK